MALNIEANKQVSSYLYSKERWRATPSYTTFSENDLRTRAYDVYDALRRVHGESVDLDEKITKTQQSLDEIFDNFRSDELEHAEYTFLVPKRITRSSFEKNSQHKDGSVSELDIHFPIYNEELGIDEDIAQRGIADLPPMIVSRKDLSPIPNQKGVIVCAPLETSMLGDYVSSTNPALRRIQQARLMRDIHKNISVSMDYIQKMGSRIVGLGATLPSPMITNFGQRINREGITTTTGHGGTVHLIAETVAKSIEARDLSSNAKIGIIGAAGSIGNSSLEVIRDRMPQLDIVAYDKKEKLLSNMIQKRGDSRNITIAKSDVDTLMKSDIIVSAIVGSIDLDIIDPEHTLDLQEKIIIDDSQPGCFNREQVESRGGKLLWVVGRDNSTHQMATRTNGFNYGSAYGLESSYDEFGCGLEAASIAATGALKYSIGRRVTPRDADNIGELFRYSNFGVANPQSFSRHVEL